MRPVDVPRITIDFPLLQRTDDLWDFSEPGYELIARCGRLCEQLIDAVNTEIRESDQALDIDEAVVGGLLVRMAKLCRAIFDSSQSDQSEAHGPLTRLAAETAVTLRWFVKADDPMASKRFRADSFVFFRQSGAYAAEGTEADDELAALIREEIDERLALAGLTWDDVPRRDQSWGPNLRQRFEALGLETFYSMLFKSHSAYVHPTWHELSALHLKREGDGYELAYSYAEMMPIGAFVIAQIMAEAVFDAARALPNDLDQESLRTTVDSTVEASQLLSVEFAEFAGRVGFEPEFMA